MHYLNTKTTKWLGESHTIITEDSELMRIQIQSLQGQDIIEVNLNLNDTSDHSYKNLQLKILKVCLQMARRAIYVAFH